MVPSGWLVGGSAHNMYWTAMETAIVDGTMRCIYHDVAGGRAGSYRYYVLQSIPAGKTCVVKNGEPLPVGKPNLLFVFLAN